MRCPSVLANLVYSNPESSPEIDKNILFSDVPPALRIWRKYTLLKPFISYVEDILLNVFSSMRDLSLPPITSRIFFLVNCLNFMHPHPELMELIGGTFLLQKFERALAQIGFSSMFIALDQCVDHFSGFILRRVCNNRRRHHCPPAGNSLFPGRLLGELSLQRSSVHVEAASSCRDIALVLGQNALDMFPFQPVH